jgi:nucleoside-diphosphate-sugar epimerase
MEKQLIKSALVVGGCGSLGHGIVKELLKIQPAVQISVFDLNTTPNRFPAVTYYEVDISDKSHVTQEFSKVKPQAIFHTASPPAGLLDLPFYMKVNVEGTRNLLDCAKVRTCFQLDPTICSSGYISDSALTKYLTRSTERKHLYTHPVLLSYTMRFRT